MGGRRIFLCNTVLYLFMIFTLIVPNSIPDEQKEATINLSVFTAAHCSLSKTDHMLEVFQPLGKRSVSENAKLHRT